MTQIFGSISSDSLPEGYGDESDVSNPTGGMVGGMGFSDAMQVAGSGSVSSFGYDATMHGLPSGEHYGKLFGEGGRWSRKKTDSGSDGAAESGGEDSGGGFKLFDKTRRETRQQERGGSGLWGFGKKESSAASSGSGGGGGGGAARFEGNAGYVWDYYPGNKVVLVSGPGGTPGQEFKAGSKTYIQAEKEWKAAGSPAPSGGGGRKGGFSLGGRKRGSKQGMSGQRAANIGAGLGSFFSQAAPTVAGLFGPKQSVDMMDFSSDGGGSVDLSPKGPSPLLIAGGVIGLIAIVGIGIAMSSGGDDD
jgi:hypothetical protein